MSPWKCSKCKTEYPSVQKYCTRCRNEQIGITCMQCGTLTPASDPFCGSCGSDLAQVHQAKKTILLNENSKMIINFRDKFEQEKKRRFSFFTNLQAGPVKIPIFLLIMVLATGGIFPLMFFFSFILVNGLGLSTDFLLPVAVVGTLIILVVLAQVLAAVGRRKNLAEHAATLDDLEKRIQLAERMNALASSMTLVQFSNLFEAQKLKHARLLEERRNSRIDTDGGDSDRSSSDYGAYLDSEPGWFSEWLTEKGDEFLADLGFGRSTTEDDE